MAALTIMAKKTSVLILISAFLAVFLGFSLYYGKKINEKGVGFAPVPPPVIKAAPAKGGETADFRFGGWEKAANPPWSKRDAHAAAAFNGKLWVMGGLEGEKGKEYWQMPQKSDVWYTEDGERWELATAKAPWGERRSISAVVFKGKLWVMGGWDKKSYKSDVWYTEDGINWTEATPAAAWSPREGQVVVVFKDKMWLMGGVDFAKRETKSDVWYTEDGINWTEATPAAAWSPRYDHAAAAFNGKLWVMGGVSFGEHAKNDIWYTEDGKRWIRAAEKAVFPPRHGHVLLVYKNSLWVLGGWNTLAGKGISDVWRSADGLEWERLPDAPWSGREDHAAAVFKEKIWVTGGMNADWNWERDVWRSKAAGQ